MKSQSRRDLLIKCLMIYTSVACAVGTAACLFIVLVRVPALAETKRDLLFGTLQGVAVSLLFAVTALLINLTFLVYRGRRRVAASLVGEPN